MGKKKIQDSAEGLEDVPREFKERNPQDQQTKEIPRLARSWSEAKHNRDGMTDGIPPISANYESTRREWNMRTWAGMFMIWWACDLLWHVSLWKVSCIEGQIHAF